MGMGVFTLTMVVNIILFLLNKEIVRFVVIKDKNEIIGTAAGIWKTINMDGIGYNGS